jgi:hypothetical protein
VLGQHFSLRPGIVGLGQRHRGPAGPCQPTRHARSALSPHGGTAGLGSPASPVQRGRRREHEDDEGRTPGKKDGGTPHQWGSGVDEVADAAARQRFFKGGGAPVTVAGSYSTGCRGRSIN